MQSSPGWPQTSYVVVWPCIFRVFCSHCSRLWIYSTSNYSLWWDRTQRFVCGRQVFYQLSYIPSEYMTFVSQVLFTEWWHSIWFEKGSRDLVPGWPEPIPQTSVWQPQSSKKGPVYLFMEEILAAGYSTEFPAEIQGFCQLVVCLGSARSSAAFVGNCARSSCHPTSLQASESKPGMPHD